MEMKEWNFSFFTALCFWCLRISNIVGGAGCESVSPHFQQVHVFLPVAQLWPRDWLSVEFQIRCSFFLDRSVRPESTIISDGLCSA